MSTAGKPLIISASETALHLAVAVRAAVNDVRLERKLGRKLRIYCDADVVLGILLGFLDGTRVTPQQEVVRAMLLSKRMGEVRLLQPHAAEVLNNLDRVVKSGTTGWSSAAKQFLEGRGAVASFDSVREILGMSNEARRHSALLDFLKGTTGQQMMIAFERVGGTPYQRFKRLGPIVESLTPSLGNLIELKDFKQAFADFESRRPNARHQNLNDAAAVALMSWLTSDSERSGTIPKFYSETDVVRRYLLDRNGSPSDMPTGDATTGAQGLPNPDPFFSSELYWLVRMTFPSLSPNIYDTLAPPTGRAESSLNKLEELSARAADAASRGDIDAIRCLEIDGLNLDRLIVRLGDLELIHKQWLQTDFAGVSRLIEESLADFEMAVADRPAFAPVVLDEIKAIRAQLVEQAGTFSEVAETCAKLFECARIASPLPAGFSASRDLGLIRWGVILPSDEEAALEQDVADLCSQDVATQMRAAARVAHDAVHRKTEYATVRAAALFWFFRRHGDVAHLFDRLKYEKLSITERVWFWAARIQLPSLPNYDTIEKTVADLLAARSTLPQDPRYGALSMGVGYILYWSWRRHSATLRETSVHWSRVAVWGRQSFQLGTEALAAAEGDELVTAFAINHCAYVAVEIGLPEDDVAPWMAKLKNLSENAGVWHYRFADTVAVYHIRRARRLLETFRRSSQINIGEAATREAHRAENLFKSIRSHHDEPVVGKHLSELDEVLDALSLPL